MSNVVTPTEIKLAQVFLRALGAPVGNRDMIFAVVAWMRVSGGSHNNPFALTPGADINALSSGVFIVRTGGRDTTAYLAFANTTLGAQAAAKRLLAAGYDYRRYGGIVGAARTGTAIDFMRALSGSAWDPTGYGGWSDPWQNEVFELYTQLQMVVYQPAPPPPPAPEPPKPAPPVPPRDLPPPVSAYEYIDPWRVQGFYRARHRHDDVLGD